MIGAFVEFFKTLFQVAESQDLVLNFKMIFWIAFACTGVIEISFFVLKGIGLYTIGKREKIAKPFLAFIPFASYYYLGRIIGPVRLFGFRIKNIGLFLSILLFLNLATTYVSDWVYYGNTLEYILETNKFVMQDAKEIVLGPINPLPLIYALNYLVSIAHMVISVFAFMAFFRFYAPKTHVLFAILSIFFEPLFSIFTFVFRKNKRFDYNQYMKMRFDSYTAQGSHGGYNNPQQPFTANKENKNDSPFEDYKVKTQTNNVGDVFTEYSDNNGNCKSENDKFSDETKPRETRTQETDDGDLF